MPPFSTLTGVNSPDPVTARHALAVAALAARLSPQAYVQAITPLLKMNLDLFQVRGSWTHLAFVTAQRCLS